MTSCTQLDYTGSSAVFHNYDCFNKGLWMLIGNYSKFAISLTSCFLGLYKEVVITLNLYTGAPKSFQRISAPRELGCSDSVNFEFVWGYHVYIRGIRLFLVSTIARAI